ncbi:hypothetical protein NGB36_10055 [Streptomyces sp. RB6PN25]|uniref:Uncharacterized protein n=1 Tax=Streptomyces humicola TaxID=2953240 RepID=A0ABT1PTD2_9ACTN|nr:hypothetical protein [Streptomyces humicola]MCQ4080934.1 hypothetical protein [Streptomyces humicola]
MSDANVMTGIGLPVTIVNACQREGRGGSPTAVLDETPLSFDERCSVPVLMGTSHPAARPELRPAGMHAPRHGMCTLGIDLGHWAPNSEAARICRTVYGSRPNVCWRQPATASIGHPPE